MRKRYSFAVIGRGKPMSHLALTYRNLVDRIPEVADVFKKYADNSFQDTPGEVFYDMSELSRSMFDLNEYKSVPEVSRTPSEVFSSPESLSPSKIILSIPRSKRKKLPLDDQEASSSTSQPMSASPKKRPSSVSKATDAIPASVEPQESTSKGETSSIAMAVRRIESPAKSTKKDPGPTTSTQESVGPSQKGKVADSPEESKSPPTPVRDESDVAKPAKRPKLIESIIAEIKCSIPKKALSPIKSAEDDDDMDVSPIEDDSASNSPSPDGKETAVSADRGKYSKENEELFNSIPVVKDNAVEMDASDKSNETSVPKYTASKAEIDALVDDISRVESIQKIVEERLKVVGISPKKAKKEPVSSNQSARRSKRLSGPSKDQASTSSSEPETLFRNLLLNSSILSYLRLSFKCRLSHRHQHLHRVYDFFQGFDSDARFLYYYSKTITLVVQENPIEHKEYFTDALNNLKNNLIRNSTDISNCLRRLIDTVKMDIPFFSKGLQDIRKLNQRFDPILCVESDPLEIINLLNRYESSLKSVWDRMDSRILLGNGFRSSLLRVAPDFIKLTKDFARYLVMIEVLHHSSIPAAEGGKRKMNIAWKEVKRSDL